MISYARTLDLQASVAITGTWSLLFGMDKECVYLAVILDCVAHRTGRYTPHTDMKTKQKLRI